MRQYQDMLYHIMQDGEERIDRTGTGTIGVFGYQNRYDLADGFPIMTTKKMNLRIIFYELDWFLKGLTNIDYLLERNVNIWNADAYRSYLDWFRGRDRNELALTQEQFIERIKTDRDFARVYGDLGPIYGSQWRSWMTGETGGAIDQIAHVIESIKNDPYGRRHIVNAWNVADIPDMALPPCHLLFQFYVSNDGRLSCELYQRSADAFLGVPFNISSYALLIHMIASLTGLKAGEFIHTFGDLHIYKNHLEQVKEQIFRKPKRLPYLHIKHREGRTIDTFEWEDFDLIGYDFHPTIKGKVSVG